MKCREGLHHQCKGWMVTFMAKAYSGESRSFGRTERLRGNCGCSAARTRTSSSLEGPYQAVTHRPLGPSPGRLETAFSRRGLGLAGRWLWFAQGSPEGQSCALARARGRAGGSRRPRGARTDRRSPSLRGRAAGRAPRPCQCPRSRAECRAGQGRARCGAGARLPPAAAAARVITRPPSLLICKRRLIRARGLMKFAVIVPIFRNIFYYLHYSFTGDRHQLCK